MANSETYFGIHIPFVSEPFLPSPRKRWFRSRSDVSAPAAFAAVRECVGTHSSRRSEGGIHSSRHGEGLVKLVVLLPDHVVNARAEQPIPRPRTDVRSSRHGGDVPPWLGARAQLWQHPFWSLNAHVAGPWHRWHRPAQRPVLRGPGVLATASTELPHPPRKNRAHKRAKVLKTLR